MIEINNLTTNAIDEEFLKKVAEIVLKGESASWRKEKADLSIALAGQGRIRELNKKYRGRNKVTDVLAFPESKVGYPHRNEVSGAGFKAGPIQKIQGLGEIVICLREVRKNAKKFVSTYNKELARVLIHGILHLFGYDHERSEKEEKIMRKKEEYYLSQFSS